MKKIQAKTLPMTGTGQRENDSYSGNISYKWINILELSNHCTRFNPLLRRITLSFNILILRNPFNAKAGIYLVGKEDLIRDVADLIVQIISTIENEVVKYRQKKSYLKYRTHGNEAIAEYRIRLIKRILKKLLEFEDQKSKDELKEFIQQSSLKNYRAFYGK